MLLHDVRKTYTIPIHDLDNKLYLLLGKDYSRAISVVDVTNIKVTKRNNEYTVWATGNVENGWTKVARSTHDKRTKRLKPNHLQVLILGEWLNVFKHHMLNQQQPWIKLKDYKFENKDLDVEEFFSVDTDNLLRKHGFGDGEFFIPVRGSVLGNWLEFPDSINTGRLGVYISDTLLITFVKTFIIPVIEDSIEITLIQTQHNPIRVRSINGVAVQDDSGQLAPKTVNVSSREVREFLSPFDTKL